VCLLSDPFDYHPVDEVKEVCYALKFKNDIGMTVDLKKGMSYQEMIWLGVWNMKFKFCDGPNSNLKYSKIKWRLPIIDAIFKLFNSACPNEFVPQGFLNALHHLILIYYNSETGSRAAPESRWKNTILTLDRCINETAPLKLEGSALVVILHYLILFLRERVQLVQSHISTCVCIFPDRQPNPER